MNIFPYRIRFTKLNQQRGLSHHELMKVLQNALKNSTLPIKYTEGFNPHPRLSLPTALGLGVESLDEVMETELTTWVAPKLIGEKLGAHLPEGIKITAIEPFVRSKRIAIEYVEYEATLDKEIPGEELQRRIENLLSKKEAVIERQREKYKQVVDIRRYLSALKFKDGKIIIHIKVTDFGTAKPEEILRALDIEITPGVRIIKTKTELRLR